MTNVWSAEDSEKVLLGYLREESPDVICGLLKSRRTRAAVHQHAVKLRKEGKLPPSSRSKRKAKDIDARMSVVFSPSFKYRADSGASWKFEDEPNVPRYL